NMHKARVATKRNTNVTGPVARFNECTRALPPIITASIITTTMNQLASFRLLVVLERLIVLVPLLL
ncbi:MAG: hypothetical protein LC808_39830, partial [Actinobacteria bacterium]|nr:hypothetical protein [Actinomycetota bacterium]